MSEVLILEIPEDLARQVRALAEATNRRPEDVVVDWISQAVAEPPLQGLNDASLLALCEAMLEPDVQEELSDLLDRAGSGELEQAEQVRLDQLMTLYRRGLVLKARAWTEAVERGLRPPLCDDAA